jgi:hypothetical protein
MGIFSRLFGQDQGKKHSIRNEIDITEAINAHMKWKARLQRCLDGNSEEKLDPMLVCRDDQCALGKWIHGPALNHFHGDEEFNALRSDHAQFHYVASNVVYKIQQDDHAGAMAIFNGEYVQASRKVIHTLTELNKQLNEA